MKRNCGFNFVVAGICMVAFAETALADNTTLNFELSPAASFYTRNTPFVYSRPYMLALNEGDAAKSQGSMPVAAASEFEPALFSGSNAHKYLGLGTVVLVGLTALSAPDDGCDCPSVTPSRQTSGTTHTRLARAAAAMAAATVTTGLLYHWDDFHFEDGLFDPDNQHAMLGAAGALLMLYAVNKSMKSAEPTSHSGLAELGGVVMAVAIKLNW